MALLTIGGEYVAGIENGWQDGRDENAQGKLNKGPQSKNTGTKNSGRNAA
jgi:hypothetical protein